MSGDAVLIVGHGTIDDVADLPEFLTRIRRGRPPDADLIAEMRHRYEAIGGSPLLVTTRAQGSALAEELGVPVHVSMRMWHPTIEEVLAEMATHRYERICVAPMAPFSVHVYADAVERALAADGEPWGANPPEVVRVAPYGDAPALVDAHVALIDQALAEFPSDGVVLLTAHSLPMRALKAGDPYQQLFEAAAQLIADRLNRRHRVAYQSQGAGGGQWLGPSLETTFEQLAADGVSDIAIAPVGFLADHVETLFDLDIEALGWAREKGMRLTRVPALNTHAGLIAALAGACREAFRKQL